MASELADRPNPEIDGGTAQPLTITVRDEADSTVVLALAGEVDLSTVETLTDCLGQAAAGSWRSVIVDLDEVTFFDSTGLATVAAAHRSLATAGRSLAVRRPCDTVRRVLVITGMGDLLLD